MNSRAYDLLAIVAVAACLGVMPLVGKVAAVCIALVLGASAGFYLGTLLACRQGSYGRSPQRG